jgi:hypothetical protein
MTNDRDNLAWLAFRYIADEMPAGEVESFEGRLAVDQAAREAVAAAVELAQAVTAVLADVLSIESARHLTLTTRHSPPTPHSARSRRWVRPVGWMAAGAAACLAAVLLLPRLGVLRDWARGRSEHAAVPNETSRLAVLWASAAFGEHAEQWAVEGWSGEESDMTDDLDEADASAPAWLLRAVFGGEAAPDEDWEET